MKKLFLILCCFNNGKIVPSGLEYASLHDPKALAEVFIPITPIDQDSSLLTAIKKDSGHFDVKVTFNQKEVDLCLAVINKIEAFLACSESKRYEKQIIKKGLIVNLTQLVEVLQTYKKNLPLFTGNLICHIICYLAAEIMAINNNLQPAFIQNQILIQDNLSLIKIILSTLKNLSFDSYKFGLLFEAFAFGSIKKHRFKELQNSFYQEIFSESLSTQNDFDNFLTFVTKLTLKILEPKFVLSYKTKIAANLTCEKLKTCYDTNLLEGIRKAMSQPLVLKSTETLIQSFIETLQCYV